MNREVILAVNHKIAQHQADGGNGGRISLFENYGQPLQAASDTYTISTVIAVDVSTTVADILSYLKTHILTDFKSQQGYTITVSADNSTATIGSLIIKRNDLVQSVCIKLEDIVKVNVTSNSGYQNPVHGFTSSARLSKSLCVKGNFLQTVLPLESMNPGVQLSKFLSSAAPSLFLIHFPQLVHEFDMSLAIKSPSGLFQHTEKPDTKYRLLSIITSISGYYEVLSNHNDYNKLEQGCKLMSNVQGEITLSLEEILPCARYMLYQLAAFIDD